MPSLLSWQDLSDITLSAFQQLPASQCPSLGRVTRLSRPLLVAPEEPCWVSSLPCNPDAHAVSLSFFLHSLPFSLFLSLCFCLSVSVSLSLYLSLFHTTTNLHSSL